MIEEGVEMASLVKDGMCSGDEPWANGGEFTGVGT